MTTYQALSPTDLINAINSANNDPNEPHTIHLAGAYPPKWVLGASFTPTANLFGPVAFPVIRRNITIDGRDINGNNPNGFTIERAANAVPFRFFAVNAKAGGGPTARLALRHITLVRGNLTGTGGGAIINDGPMVLYRCTIRDSSGLGFGGAIYNGDGQTLHIISSIFRNNSATGANAKGGAIYSSSNSRLLVKTSVFMGNSVANGDGAAVYFQNNLEARINRTAIQGNTSSVGNSVYNFGSVLLNARCNWWGVGTGANTPGADRIGGSVSGNYNASNPVGYSIAYEEMLFPVFGVGRTVTGMTLQDDQLIPAVTALSYDENHKAVDIVPIHAFNQGTTCQQRRELTNHNWDLSYQDYQAGVPASESLKTVYAVIDGTLTAFIPSNPAPCAVPCNAQIAPNANITDQYDNYLFSYSHVVLIPPLANNQQRQVFAGQPIGYIRNHQQDTAAGPPSHLHFAVFKNGTPIDPRQYLVTGLMDNGDQKGWRNLCPDQACP